MNKKSFIIKMMQLGAELDKTKDKFQILMIINDSELLYDNHIKELTQENGMILCKNKE